MSEPCRTLLVLLFIAGTGCIGVPTSGPASASSTGGASAPEAVLARAISEEPPLPGAANGGWSGLGAPARPAGHAHHAGMDMGGMGTPPRPPAAPTESTSPDETETMPPESALPAGEHNHGR